MRSITVLLLALALASSVVLLGLEASPGFREGRRDGCRFGPAADRDYARVSRVPRNVDARTSRSGQTGIVLSCSIPVLGCQPTVPNRGWVTRWPTTLLSRCSFLDLRSDPSWSDLRERLAEPCFRDADRLFAGRGRRSFGMPAHGRSLRLRHGDLYGPSALPASGSLYGRELSGDLPGHAKPRRSKLQRRLVSREAPDSLRSSASGLTAVVVVPKQRASIPPQFVIRDPVRASLRASPVIGHGARARVASPPTESPLREGIRAVKVRSEAPERELRHGRRHRPVPGADARARRCRRSRARR